MNDDSASYGSGPVDFQEDRRKIVYVANMKFETDEQGLREAFSQFGRVRSVRIPVNDHGRRKGFGFVQFDTEEEASRAVEGMQGQELDGRELRVNISEPRPANFARRDNTRGYGGDYRGYAGDYRGYGGGGRDGGYGGGNRDGAYGGNRDDWGRDVYARRDTFDDTLTGGYFGRDVYQVGSRGFAGGYGQAGALPPGYGDRDRWDTGRGNY